MNEPLPDPAPLTSAEASRVANGYIVELAERLETERREDQPIGLLCECGCFGIVETSLAGYRMLGAWLTGHQPAS